MTEMPVLVNVPNETSVVTDASGEPHYVEIDQAGRRVVWLPVATARAMLNSGLPCSLEWKSVNMALAAALGAPPKPEPGLHIASYLQTLEASRPLHPKDIRGTLRELGVLR
jgi:hypothetical protein